MPGDPTRVDPVVIGAWLDDAALDLDAARRLADDPLNRHAAFHLQQAAEKLIKAVRLSRGLHATAEHNLVALVAALPETDSWRTKLAVLEPLTVYSTAYRYPAPSGRTKSSLSKADVHEWIGRIAALVTEARMALGTTAR